MALLTKPGMLLCLCCALAGCAAAPGERPRTPRDGGAACYCGSTPHGARYCRYRTPWTCTFTRPRQGL